jgi:hypothetical protein
MADKLLQVKTDKPGSSTVTLIDAEPSTTGYRLMDLDLGNANFEKVFSGMRGTQGAALVGENAQNRVSTWTLEVVGTSMDDFMAKASVLYQLDEELRAFGGTVTWRAQGSTYKMTLKVLDSGVNPKGQDWLWEHRFRSRFDFAVVTRPYMDGESMDIYEDFAADPANLVTNPNFEIDTSGWATTGTFWLNAGATISNDNTPLFGFRALRIITPGAATQEGAQTSLQVTAGVTYSVSLYMKATTTHTVTVGMGGAIFQNGGAQMSCALTTSWQRFTLTFTPNTSGSADLAIFTPSAQARTWWVDGVRVEVARTANPFVDDLADFTFDAGDLVGVASGALVPFNGNLTVEKRLIHTSRGYLYGDVQASIFFAAGTTITGFKAGVILKRTDAANYLEIYVDDNGTNSRLRLDKVVAGVRTNLSTTNLGARITTGSSNYVRGRIEGNVVFLDYSPGVLTLINTPTTTANVTLAGGDATQFGAAAVGSVGFSWIPQSSNATLDNFLVEAFVRRFATTPTKIQFSGPIPGDAPALSKIVVGTAAAGPQVPFALLSWTRSTGATSNVPFGVIEAESTPNLVGWASAADANYRGGNGLKATVAGAANLDAAFSGIDLRALEPDDYRDDEVEIELWGRFELASTLVNPTVIVRGSWGVRNTYTAEYGTAGKPLVLPSSGTQFRFVRLGTLTMPVATGGALVAGTIGVNATTTGGSGQFGFDYLVITRANRRVLSPTAKAYDSNYPPFLFTGGLKVIRPDLSGRLLALSAPDVELWDSGLGGSLIELPPGLIDLTVKLSSLVPDDPTANSTTETLSHAATIQLRDVRPRWRLGR